MVRSVAIGFIGAALACGTAAAQAPPAFTWTGFYLGVNVGALYTEDARTSGREIGGDPTLGGFASGSEVTARGANARLNGGTGFAGGGQIGYNLRFGGFVAGVEADIQATSLNRQETLAQANTQTGPFPPVVSNVTIDRRFGYLGTVRGRLGYLLTESLLVYGTGGLAYADIRTSASVSEQFTSNATLPFQFGTAVQKSRTETGYTAGGGVEYALSANWSAKLEGLYYDLGRSKVGSSNFSSFNSSGNLFTTSGFNVRADNSGVIGRFGLSYKFDSF